jgi:fatty acid desaturase
MPLGHLSRQACFAAFGEPREAPCRPSNRAGRFFTLVPSPLLPEEVQMSLSNQEKFVNSFWVIILLVAVGIYFWVIPKNSIAEAYSKKKHYNLKKTSRFLAVGFWIIAISCVPVLISLWFDTPWICIICVILLVLGTSVLHDYESGGKLK